jgi:transaldolase
MSLSLHRQIGTTSSFRIPQVLTEARVGGRCGEILDLPFFVPFYFNSLLSFWFDQGFLLLWNIKPTIPDMKFFIDTANLKEIQEAYELGVLDGVTTNPSLMAKEGITGKDNIMRHYKAICDIVDGDVSAEVVSVDLAGMIREGEELVEIDDKIVVKIPMIKEGVKALKYFSQKGIRTNCTLIFSAGQALLAAKAGATYVSPFVGRLDDISTDGIALIEQILLIYRNYGFDTQVLAASVRHPMHIIQCAEVGADVMTGPLSAMEQLLKHPLTDIGLEKFLADYAKGNS